MSFLQNAGVVTVRRLQPRTHLSRVEVVKQDAATILPRVRHALLVRSSGCLSRSSLWKQAATLENMYTRISYRPATSLIGRRSASPPSRFSSWRFFWLVQRFPQTKPGPASRSVRRRPTLDSMLYEYAADRVVDDVATGRVVFTGNVVLKYKDVELRAGRIVLHRKTKRLEAEALPDSTGSENRWPARVRPAARSGSPAHRWSTIWRPAAARVQGRAGAPPATILSGRADPPRSTT